MEFSRTPSRLSVDLRIHFVKANGRTSPKVFKVAVVTLEPNSGVQLTKHISLRQQSTRVHYTGDHRVDAVINGATHAVGAFRVDRAPTEGVVPLLGVS